MPEFDAYAIGISNASVCTSLPLDEATARMNAEHPTGISSNWEPAADPEFRSGEPNPCNCLDYPGNKHYLFHC